jgi:hypothetical protein
MTSYKFIGAVCVWLAGAGVARADTVNGATATGSAAIEIYAPIAVKQTQGLDFGAVTSGAAGSVAVDAGSGARVAFGGVAAVAGGTGPATPNAGRQATFTITGRPNAAITVAVGPAITGLAQGVTGVTSAPSLPTALVGDSATFSVGGALNIPANVPVGSYAGSFTIAVNYP